MLPEVALTVALIIGGEVRVVSVSEAEKLLRSTDQRLQVAATLALGTRATEPQPVTHLEPHNLFRERFQRQPAQAPVPDN